MHVEPLEKLPRSVREFLSHYAMIVLSILTALALERAALSLEHRHEGQRAKEEIEQEIASNRQQLHESLLETRAILQDWETREKRTVADVRAGQATNESLLATLTEAGHHFRDALPTLKTTAWDAAISDHSIDYLTHEDLTRFSALYAAQRTFSQTSWDVVRDSAARDLSALSLAVALGKPDPVQTVATLNGRLRTLAILESQTSQLDAVMNGGRAEDVLPPAMVAPQPASAASR
jgi:hypothetical protein